MDKIKTVATINFKGGVGKTTITWCLGDYISEYPEKKVILFDLDAQMSLTQSVAYNEDLLKNEKFSVWEKLSHDKKQTIIHSISKYIKSGKNLSNFEINYDFIYRVSQNYHFIPSNEGIYFLELEEVLGQEGIKALRTFIMDLLNEISLSNEVEGYDYAIFDCPPSFSQLSYSILSCCDLVLVPVNPDIYAVRGIGMMLKAIHYRIKSNNPLKIAIFMNKAKFNNSGILTKDSQFYWNGVKNICNDIINETGMDIKCFDSHIAEKVDMKKAVTGHKGIPDGFIRDFKYLWNNIKEYLE